MSSGDAVNLIGAFDVAQNVAARTLSGNASGI
jgi:hypothetical protein